MASGTLTEGTRTALSGGKIVKQTLSWVSHTDGSVDQTTTGNYQGFLVRCTTNPGATAPTDNYDLELRDEDGADILAGAGANRDTANSETIIPSAPPLVTGTLQVIIGSAGSAKIGDIVLYFYLNL